MTEEDILDELIRNGELKNCQIKLMAKHEMELRTEYAEINTASLEAKEELSEWGMHIIQVYGLRALHDLLFEARMAITAWNPKDTIDDAVQLRELRIEWLNDLADAVGVPHDEIHAQVDFSDAPYSEWTINEFLLDIIRIFKERED